MSGETQYGTPGSKGSGIECTEFELLLSEAVDEQLSGAMKQRFEAHRRVCPVCGPLFAEARAGQDWLHSLGEVEPPANLVHNILAATTGLQTARTQASAPAGRAIQGRVQQWWDSFLAPTIAFVRQPRFVMSFGMIFFTFSLGLSAAGVKPSDLAHIDLRPTAVRRAYYSAEVRVVKFYDNIRFVYEIESRVREFKRETRPAEPGPEDQKQNRKNNTSGKPDEKQERNYSREENQPILAGLSVPSTELRVARCEWRVASREGTAYPLPSVAHRYPPAVVTTNRRFV